MKLMESRNFEIRSREMTLEGTPILFGQMTFINGHNEIINDGALDGVSLDDIFLFYNHNDKDTLPLAKSPETMQLELQRDGLHMRATLNPSLRSREIYEAVRRGDLRGMSFSFTVEKDEYRDNIRIIQKIGKIYEVSIVPYPAYKNATVQTLEESSENSLAYKNTLEQRSKEEMKLNPITGQNLAVKEFGNDVTDTKEYRAAFFKNILGQTLSETEQAAFSLASKNVEQRNEAFINSTTAASVIPTGTLDEVISKARTQGNLLSECRGFSVPSKIAIPVSTPSNKAAWHVEGATVESESVTPTNIIFDPFELIKIFSISAKAKKMSITAFESYLQEELSSSIFEALDYSLINGSGSGEPKGLMNAVTWNNTNCVSGAINYENIISTIALLKRGYTNGAKWVMNNACLYNNFYGLTDTTKRPIFVADPQNDSIGKILGFEVIIDDNMPNDVVILGNFSYIGYNLPEGILIEISRDSSFRKGLIDMRALAIADIQIIVPEAFVKLTKTNG